VFRARGEGRLLVELRDGPLEREQRKNYEAAIQGGHPPQPIYKNFGDYMAGRGYKDPCGGNAESISSTDAERRFGPRLVEGIVTSRDAPMLAVGKMTIKTAKGEETYDVGVFTFVYRKGETFHAYLNTLRVGEHVRAKLADGDNWVQRIDVLDDAVPASNEAQVSEVRSTASEVQQQEQTEGQFDIEGTLQLEYALGSVTAIWLKVDDWGQPTRLRNTSEVPVFWNGKVYRVRNLDDGDRVRVRYFSPTREARPEIEKPVSITVLKSVH
jgi:hypothetical protein